jgi:hypothetical protein
MSRPRRNGRVSYHVIRAVLQAAKQFGTIADEPSLPAKPSTVYAPPGSEARLQLFERRAAAHQSLHHVDDVLDDPRPHGPAHWQGNGNGEPMADPLPRNNAKPGTEQPPPPSRPRIVTVHLPDQ